MTASVAYRGRLPGVRCDPALPRAAAGAIRLDGTALVGFAERGPVDDPVLIEDPAQYATVFGGDLPLAFDDHGVPQYAVLPDAVRGFFANGGRRAWVVRVVGETATTLDVPVRVTSRRPLGDGRAVTALTAGSSPLVELAAASPGGWAARVAVDVDVVDTVLALATDRSGTVDLTPATTRLLDEGDAVLVHRGTDWLLLVVPAAPDTVAPPGGWLPGDVARLLRVDLTVRAVPALAADGAGRNVAAEAVEQFGDLRFGPGTGRSRTWTDVLQPADGPFRRDRSMYLRAPADDRLVPMLGPVGDPVPTAETPDIPAPGTRAALAADGLEVFDPVALFLDPDLRGHTVEGLELALEVLGLDDGPRSRGVHAIALESEVAIVAVPDLYHRPWTEQAVLADPDRPVPEPAPTEPPAGFVTCRPPEPPVPPSSVPPGPPAVLRMVVDPPATYDPVGLHDVAVELVDLCAARADMVAVLGLPRHAGQSEADHLADVLADRRAATADVPSYAGIWHPWGAVLERATPARSPLRSLPLDGAVAGTMAASELTRGWWVEPAGIALAGVLDADPVDPASLLALFDRGCNVVHRRPAGFVATSAHTVSADRSLLQLSVRRLLIAVRKLALREGARYVFEPDDDRFRSQVALTFRTVLDGLRRAGALAAFAVEVESLATRSLADEGKLRVDLKLAPTSPIEFITVTLLRSGDDLVQVSGR